MTNSLQSNRGVPPTLYERVAVQLRADPALTLLDLHNVAVRERLAVLPAVRHELQCWGFEQLDRGALLAPYRTLTQAVTGAVLRDEIVPLADGLFAESRHQGDIVVVFFGSPFEPKLAIVFREAITPAHAEVTAVAAKLGLMP